MDAQPAEVRADEFTPASPVVDPPRVEWLEESTGARCVRFSEPDFSRLKTGEGCLMSRLAKAIGDFEGKVAKDRRNPDQNYNYASVDEVTKVCRELSSDNGVVVLTLPITRALEKVQFRNSTGRRMCMVFRVAVFSAEDPEDRMTWDMEVANDGTQDKGHQVCMSTARKAALIEIFQLPRGDAEDHEAQRHPGLGAGETTNGTAGSPAGKVEDEVVRLVEAGKAADAWKAIRAAAGSDQSGEISEARRNRLFAIARKEGGWREGDVRDLVKAELGIELERMPYGVVYPAVVAFFQSRPPTDGGRAAAGTAAQSEQHEWGWEEVWDLTRTAFGKVDASVPQIGEAGARELATELGEAGFEPRVLAAVVRTELRVTVPELPQTDASGRSFPAWITRGLGRFEAPTVAEFMADEIDPELDACPWMKEEGRSRSSASTASAEKPTPPPAARKDEPASPPLEAVLAPLESEPGAFPGDDEDTAWATIATAYGELLEHHEDAATAYCTPDDRLSLFSAQRNGGRNSAAVRAELQARIGCAPDRLPAVLFEAALATLRAFPPEAEDAGVAPTPPAIPDGWQKLRLPQLSELVQGLVVSGHLRDDEIGRSVAGGHVGKKDLAQAVKLVLSRSGGES